MYNRKIRYKKRNGNILSQNSDIHTVAAVNVATY